MNKIHLVLIFAIVALTAGVFLSVLWWFLYSFIFGKCTTLSYNIAPGANCEFNSILDCSSAYCAHLFVSFQIAFNYTSFIPVSAYDDSINPYSCWNVLPFADLKLYLLNTYPIGESRTCYINFENRLILSNDSFKQATKDMILSGIILASSGVGILLIYLLFLYFTRKRDTARYEIL